MIRNINDEIINKINLDELYEKKKNHDLFTVGNYNKILNRIHNKIKHVSRSQLKEEYCWFIVPEMILGIPAYNQSTCIAYIIDKLQENGFNVRYTHPNMLFISWSHWIPNYVREEIKKKTGNIIDGYGNILNQNNENKKKENNDDILNNNLLMNNTDQNKNTKNKNANIKDISSYKSNRNLDLISSLKL